MKKPHLVYLGLSGFPRGMAPIQRQKLLSKSLIKENWDVSVICGRGVHNKEAGVLSSGFVEGIYYEYFHSATRIQGFINRNIYKILAPFGEFIILSRMKKGKGISAAIVTDRNLIWDALKYRVFALILGFDIYINLVELYKHRPKLPFLIKVNDYIFNKIGCYLYDGIIPISTYLMEETASFKKKTLLVPIITDTTVFDEIKIERKNHILYCGSASYYEAILVVLRAFADVKNLGVNLILVIGGSKGQIEKVKTEVSRLGIHARVEIRSNISDLELNSLYASAQALLLPLFQTIQDEARFPHKFGEYLASGSVVITNPVGEIKNYLSHHENVIFASNNEPVEMAYWIDWVLDNELESKVIGLKGKEIAKTFFDYRAYGTLLSNFFLEP